MGTPDDHVQRELEAAGYMPVSKRIQAEAFRLAGISLSETDIEGPRWVYARHLNERGRLVWAPRAALELYAYIAELGLDAENIARFFLMAKEEPGLLDAVLTVASLGELSKLAAFLREHQSARVRAFLGE